MKRREFALGSALVALPGMLASPAWAQSGKGYTELKERAPVEAPAGQVEVVEFFSYGCSHCKNFEPMFSAWKKSAPKDVAVRMVHVGFQSSFEPLQRIYYALEALGQVDALHAKVFDALQAQRKRLNQPDVLFPWIAEQGVDRAKFEEAYKSFGVATKLRRAVQLQEAYQVEGTPALGVAGRYYTDGSMAGGFQRMIQLTNGLIEQERKRG
ncbi:thiol:disulfide interchange protein DsbA/DsbL [Ottowia sp.]|uniref:thiol:disulfide interchange protein DsbA/DsbL n=1 Tax=Ottowia sp. TaxID=1898956 RepID=UPI002BF85F7D|nr:thiol:disulfide interchange protein DsbA/DsbL [Ottowia sp.]HRN75843.1 thiol:disulfide interchange protein DsbA/DsbL [Ottowia sp.]HRQ03187.1 thiol:disulfide interchange protein DsbA/DsbL [Ottowia sp.]